MRNLNSISRKINPSDGRIIYSTKNARIHEHGGLYLSDQIKSADTNICQLVEYYHVAGEGEELMPQNR